MGLHDGWCTTAEYICENLSCSKEITVLLEVGSNPLLALSIKVSIHQECPLITGISVAATTLGGRYMIQAWQSFKARPIDPRARRFYEGGFQQVLTKREAALILSIRERDVMEKIKEAHRRVMVANHPDSGGSHYLASKINEAKNVFTGRTKSGGSAF
ncbi:mitochondrial import inner membrane translocase subunit TIM14-1-like [Tasmannia lanceolata]|uniref:mitochondrial import inner membrane translocase subunit TIM14-1-like n=1 Tax=Tasmannia lanceolata TaxID=3420 RepID=UPI004062A211